MVVSDTPKSTRYRKKYADIDLWVKIIEDQNSAIDNTNRKIDELLAKYAKEGL